MALAWSCLASAAHGPFLQTGLDNLAKDFPGLQPPHQYRCPVCRAQGEPGFVRPASKTEAARFAVNQGEAAE